MLIIQAARTGKAGAETWKSGVSKEETEVATRGRKKGSNDDGRGKERGGHAGLLRSPEKRAQRGVDILPSTASRRGELKRVFEHGGLAGGEDVERAGLVLDNERG